MHGQTYEEFILGVSGFLTAYYTAVAIMNAVAALYLWQSGRAQALFRFPIIGVMVSTAHVWIILSGLFLMLGAAATNGGAAILALPPWLRDFADARMGPVTYSLAVLAVLAVMYVGRKFFVKPIVAWALLNLSLLAMGLSMTDTDFASIVMKPDNVPIVAMIYLLGYFTWLGAYKAVQNDERIARGERPPEALDNEKVLVWPNLVYTELICMIAITAILLLWGIGLQAPLEELASFVKTANLSKAPWYFLGLQEMLVYYDPWMAGVVLPSVVVGGLMAIAVWLHMYRVFQAGSYEPICEFNWVMGVTLLLLMPLSFTGDLSGCSVLTIWAFPISLWGASLYLLYEIGSGNVIKSDSFARQRVMCDGSTRLLGMTLLIVPLFLSFTLLLLFAGYWLTWNQLAIWTVLISCGVASPYLLYDSGSNVTKRYSSATHHVSCAPSARILFIIPSVSRSMKNRLILGFNFNGSRKNTLSAIQQYHIEGNLITIGFSVLPDCLRVVIRRLREPPWAWISLPNGESQGHSLPSSCVAVRPVNQLGGALENVVQKTKIAGLVHTAMIIAAALIEQLTAFGGSQYKRGRIKGNANVATKNEVSSEHIVLSAA